MLLLFSSLIFLQVLFLTSQFSSTPLEERVLSEARASADASLTDLLFSDSNPNEDSSDSDMEIIVNLNEIEETEVYIIDLVNEEDIIVIVEAVEDSLQPPHLVGNNHPIVIHTEDVTLTSWWTLENEEYGFETWDDLEAFIESEYREIAWTGIDPNAEDLPINLEISIVGDIEEENQEVRTHQNVVKGLDILLVNALHASVKNCAQIVACQDIFVRGAGYVSMCKNQLVCGEPERENENSENEENDS